MRLVDFRQNETGGGLKSEADPHPKPLKLLTYQQKPAAHAGLERIL